MEFRTSVKNKINHSKPMIPDKERLVEKAGYVPANQRIKQMIQAGQRLVASRQELYDFKEGEFDEDIPIDPTRSGDFDLADASMLQNEVTDRLNSQAEDAKLKASQKAQDQPGKVETEGEGS